MRIAFVSLIPAPWGGSEELWCRAAHVLRSRGAVVAVGVRPWPTPVSRIEELAGLGCRVHWHAFPGRRARLLTRLGLPEDRALGWLVRFRPDLVVHSVCSHNANLAVDSFCRRHGLKYVRLVQLAGERWWPSDAVLDEYTRAYTGAAACCFVSHANRRLVETQIGATLPNARVVWNPYTVPPGVAPWPSEAGGLALACVGRLDPESKGQDLLLTALARDRWAGRGVRLSFYGRGPGEASLRRLASHLGFAEPRVRFAGFAPDIRAVWDGHHALALTSREEGMPLAGIEAMSCGRVPILTAVGGNSELVADGETGFLAAAPTAAHVDEALERAWAHRREWRDIGERAARSVRARAPADPGGAFADLVTETAGRGAGA